MCPAVHTPLAPKDDNSDSGNLGISEVEEDSNVVGEDCSEVVSVASRICKRQRGEQDAT